MNAATGAVTVTNTGSGASPAGPTNTCQKNGGAGAFGAMGCSDDGTTVTFTEPIATPAVSIGDGTKSAISRFKGVTSGEVALGAADIAGTAIAYVLPSTNGVAGQFLEDNGVTTCPTFAAGAPAVCHQLIWGSAGGTTTPTFISTPVTTTSNIASVGMTITIPAGSLTAGKYVRVRGTANISSGAGTCFITLSSSNTDTNSGSSIVGGSGCANTGVDPIRFTCDVYGTGSNTQSSSCTNGQNSGAGDLQRFNTWTYTTASDMFLNFVIAATGGITTTAEYLVMEPGNF